MTSRLIPYDPSYETALLEMERGIEQGRWVRLEIMKERFLDRAVVFPERQALMLVDDEGLPIASGICASTHLSVDGEEFPAGIGFDVKVSPPHRNQGNARRIAKAFYSEFFRPKGLTRNFTTLKHSNTAVHQLVAGMLNDHSLYDFIYLVIPTNTSIGTVDAGRGKAQLLHVDLFTEDGVDGGYHKTVGEGLSYFRTWMMYRLKLTRIHPIVSWASRTAMAFSGKGHLALPRAGDELRLATLYGHHAGNLGGLPALMEDLKAEGVSHLLACCRKGDLIHAALKPYSIFNYEYFLLADFPVRPDQTLKLDVRCL